MALSGNGRRLCCCCFVFCAPALTLRGTETISGLVSCSVTATTAGCPRALATVFVIRAVVVADSFFPPPAFVTFFVDLVPPVALVTVNVFPAPAPADAVTAGTARIAAADFERLSLGGRAPTTTLGGPRGIRDDLPEAWLAIGDRHNTKGYKLQPPPYSVCRCHTF